MKRFLFRMTVLGTAVLASAALADTVNSPAPADRQPAAAIAPAGEAGNERTKAEAAMANDAEKVREAIEEKAREAEERKDDAAGDGRG